MLSDGATPVSLAVTSPLFLLQPPTRAVDSVASRMTRAERERVMGMALRVNGESAAPNVCGLRTPGYRNLPHLLYLLCDVYSRIHIGSRAAVSRADRQKMLTAVRR